MAVVQKQNNMPNKTKPTVKQQIKGNAKLKKAYKKSSKKQLAGIKQNLSNLSTEELMKRRKQSPTKLGPLGNAMKKSMPSVNKMKKESPTKAVSAIIAGIAKVAKVAGKVAKVASKAGKVGKFIGKGAQAVSKVAGKIGTAAKTAKGAKIVKTADKVTRGLQGAYRASGGVDAGKGGKTNVAAGMKKINFGGKTSPFAMKGFTGFGNSPVKAKTEAAKRLLKAVPNQKAYDKLSDIEKQGFNKAAKKAKLPMKKSPAKAGQTAGQIVRRERLMT